MTRLRDFDLRFKTGWVVAEIVKKEIGLTTTEFLGVFFIGLYFIHSTTLSMMLHIRMIQELIYTRFSNASHIFQNIENKLIEDEILQK